MKGNLNFALFFGNRGFFPGEVIEDARKEMYKAVTDCGFGALMLEKEKTRFGAVETVAEGSVYAAFLREHIGEYDGVILCLPNFGDENGAYAALKDVDVPILVQAYPDEIGNMDFSHRRDALCGKIAICNVLRQAGIKYTLTNRFAVKPLSEEFKNDLCRFAAICRVVKGMRSFNIGAIGARTTAFKTVRVDEIAMQKKHINIETFDLASVFSMMDAMPHSEIRKRAEYYRSLSDFGSYPNEKVENIARLGLTVDRLIEQYDLSAVAVRCWDELQKCYGIAPCLILSDLNEKGIYASCELDICNCVMMRALGLAADYPVMLFDVNNNYGDSSDKVVFFHCGPAPQSMMAEKGHIEEHLMFKKTYGPGSGVGINVGKIINGSVTVGSLKTEKGNLFSFVTEGCSVEKQIDDSFFGCHMIFQKADGNIETMLRYMGSEGYRHHVAITKGNWAPAVHEALKKYLEIENDLI